MKGETIPALAGFSSLFSRLCSLFSSLPPVPSCGERRPLISVPPCLRERKPHRERQPRWGAECAGVRTGFFLTETQRHGAQFLRADALCREKDGKEERKSQQLKGEASPVLAGFSSPREIPKSQHARSAQLPRRKAQPPAQGGRLFDSEREDQLFTIAISTRRDSFLEAFGALAPNEEYSMRASSMPFVVRY